MESARRFWMEVTGAPPDRFRTPTLKHHNPKTVRKKVGEDYHGRLRIDVHRSADLYRKIEGWAGAGMAGRRGGSAVPAGEKPAAIEPADAATTALPVS
jgi:hypothetical protein